MTRRASEREGAGLDLDKSGRGSFVEEMRECNSLEVGINLNKRLLGKKCMAKTV